jgi:hypothetical protein
MLPSTESPAYRCFIRCFLDGTHARAGARGRESRLHPGTRHHGAPKRRASSCNDHGSVTTRSREPRCTPPLSRRDAGRHPDRELSCGLGCPKRPERRSRWCRGWWTARAARKRTLVGYAMRRSFADTDRARTRDGNLPRAGRKHARSVFVGWVGVRRRSIRAAAHQNADTIGAARRIVVRPPVRCGHTADGQDRSHHHRHERGHDQPASMHGRMLAPRRRAHNRVAGRRRRWRVRIGSSAAGQIRGHLGMPTHGNFCRRAIRPSGWAARPPARASASFTA